MNTVSNPRLTEPGVKFFFKSDIEKLSSNKEKLL